MANTRSSSIVGNASPSKRSPPTTLKRRLSYRKHVLQEEGDLKRVPDHSVNMRWDLATLLFQRQTHGIRGNHWPRHRIDTISVDEASAEKNDNQIQQPPWKKRQSAHQPQELIGDDTKLDDLTTQHPPPSSPSTVTEPQPSHLLLSHGASNDSTNIDKANEDSLEATSSIPTIKKMPPLPPPRSIFAELIYWVEYRACVHFESANLLHLGGGAEEFFPSHPQYNARSSRAVSTIAIAFSPDGQTLASTHGDHTVKISSCHTGRLLATLEGHPRTPWTCKYNPTNPHIVASGCLGHQVRVWNWTLQQCLQMVRLEFAIISLTFHPSGKCLCIANGTRLHFWKVQSDNEQSPNAGDNSESASNPSGQASSNNTMILHEMDQRHMLRCVAFPPNGNTLVVGGVNPDNTPRRAGSRPAQKLSFYLRLWEFSLKIALSPATSARSQGSLVTLHPISKPRIIVPRALLYNDGGFDISPDGKRLCACVEYWLPDGVDNAMELVFEEEEKAYQDTTDDDVIMDIDSGDQVQSQKEDYALSPTKPRSAAGYQTPPPPIPPPTTPTATVRVTNNQPVTGGFSTPRTPEPSSAQTNVRLSPPPPPGRRLGEFISTHQPSERNTGINMSAPPPLPPGGSTSLLAGNNSPPPTIATRPPHALSTVTSTAYSESQLKNGRYVPHVVAVSLEVSTPAVKPQAGIILPQFRPRSKLQPQPDYPALASGYQPRLGQLLQACPLEPGKAAAVTCVKFSPSCEFVLLGYGVREQTSPSGTEGIQAHPVTAIYRLNQHVSNPSTGSNESDSSLVSPGIDQISTMLSRNDDVNIARFHGDSGHGFVYGTKQGRVRIVSPRPWMLYHAALEEEEE